MGVLKYYDEGTGTWTQAIVGVQGPTGATGPAGDPGGATGPQGATGATGIGYYGNSTSSLTPSNTGSVTFVTDIISTAYAVGSRIRVASAYNNYFEGTITAITPSITYPYYLNFTVLRDFSVGSTTSSLWDISIAGQLGSTGATGATGPAGSAGVAQNVLYVSKSGNDAYTGTDLNNAKLTIKAAAAIATSGTTIFVKSGDYTEINPISVPAGVAIVGDNLRTTTVRPLTPTADIFQVRNKCYITGFTFRDHLTPSAAIAFPTTGAGAIITSPYIQNCSSITTTGCGIRIDGSLALGLKSMVMDSYTQFNQGGIGVHVINQGYAQLVSIFTICCTAGVKCESGGSCSITNSNNSFGDYGLYADGTGPTLYSGTVVSNTIDTITISGLSQRPAVGDGFLVASSGQYLSVRAATALVAGVSVVAFAESLTFTPTPGATVDFMQLSLISASNQTFEYIGTGTNILTATPRLGGIPIQANEVFMANGGRVNYTSTDQFGDFRVGEGLMINEQAGIIEGTTFDKSLFAVMTPYILALEG
jgi:hypothetical protein